MWVVVVWWVVWIAIVGLVACGAPTRVEEDDVAELKGSKLEEYKARLATDKLIKRAEQDRQGLGFTSGGVLGPIPGSWRPFEAGSPWNISHYEVADWGTTNEFSTSIINEAAARSTITFDGKKCVTFSGAFNIPIWNVIGADLPQRRAHSASNIYEEWDADGNDCSDVFVPWDVGMWSEPYPVNDGHICIVDLTEGSNGKLWEMSRFEYPCPLSNHCQASPADVKCTTYNEWDLAGQGYEDQPWSGPPFPHGATSRGGRGGGTPGIAGMIRPEEVLTGQIRHAMCFTYSGIRRDSSAANRKLYYAPPCCRSDSDSNNTINNIGTKYMIYGSLIRLDPEKTTADFLARQITNTNVHVVLRCLQEYGAYLVDYGGGGIKFSRQKIALNQNDPQNIEVDVNLWNSLCGSGFIEQMSRVPTDWFFVFKGDDQVETYWDP